MRSFFKKIIPPFLIDLYRDIYIKNLIAKNKKLVVHDKQDIKIYDTDLTAEKLSEWGKGSTWNEIQMFFVSKKGNILDLACGTGINMRDIKKLSPEANIYGCDISQNLIDICLESGIERNKLICSDAIKIDFPENFFDYSYSVGSLEHFTETGLDDVIKKLHSITKSCSIHMMPVSKKNQNEGWIKTYQTFHNNSVEWWENKFKKKFSKVSVIESSWKDHISVGKWFVCFK
jgi:ubiquinone/menaquinone biosynthesis C-methylase UbiE